jgi:thymidylate synthase
MEEMDLLANQNRVAFLEMFDKTMSHGHLVKPRGFTIAEVEDLQLTVSPLFPFMAFIDRKYNFEYFKKEMLWKLTANKYDQSIKQHAKMWESVQNPDGTFNSNYGQFWFGEQQGFWSVVMELLRDKDSRRAVIPMLSKEHMKPETVDTVCTESVGFRIRNGELNMSIHMRSSDQIFGLGTDIPTFAFLYRLVFGVLQAEHHYLACGNMTITAMSSHIYERHFEMVADILRAGPDGYEEVEMPFCTSIEALKIIASRGKDMSNTGELGKWLVS